MWKPFTSKASGMGRGKNDVLEGKVHLCQVPLNGDYDQGGAYWGAVDRIKQDYLWCAYNDHGAFYVRASTRAQAKELIRKELPKVSFFR